MILCYHTTSGAAGSYTDFHVDFGGTSVWYHVLRGHKRFFLIPPSAANLKAYEKWTCSKSQDTVFLGDVVGKDECFQVDLLAGQTLMIPGAWIHAVFTPADSLVFGGNFLHSYNIVRQLQVYLIEQKTHVGKQYRFPHFKVVNWYVLTSLLPIARKRLLGTAAQGNGRNTSVIYPFTYPPVDPPSNLSTLVSPTLLFTPPLSH